MNGFRPADQGTLLSRLKKMFLSIFIIVCACYLSVCLMLFLSQRSLIYAARKSPVSVTDADYDPAYIQDVSLHVDEGIDLLGWYCTVNHHQDAKADRLALIFPGNGGNRLNRVKLLRLMNELGCDALIFDYRGYGGSGGEPSEEVIATDSPKVWDFAKDQLGYRNDQIVVLGQSLGGGVSTRLVSELCEKGDAPAGFILQATFTSLGDAAQHRYPWLPVKLLLTERYPSIDRIGKVTCPLLFLHGKQDEIVPYRLGRQLFAAAPDKSANGLEKKLVDLAKAGHNDIMYVALDEMTAAKREFLDEIDQLQAGGE